MIHSKKTKSSFSLRGNKTKQGFLLIYLLIWNCAGGAYQDMAIEDPARLISLEDSLSRSDLSESTIGSLTLAHKTLGEKAMVAGKYETARDHFSKTLNLSPKDTMATFNHFLVQGHILYKSGKKDNLWDAIQVYHRAATIIEGSGEPHYHIARAYHKIGDKDFDLIIESYDRALGLELKPELRELASRARSEAADRDNRLKDFWK